MNEDSHWDRWPGVFDDLVRGCDRIAVKKVCIMKGRSARRFEFAYGLDARRNSLMLSVLILEKIRDICSTHLRTH